MELFELVLVLLLTGAVLTVVAQRIGAPYPALLAVAGAALALIPPALPPVLDPELSLALFVAPTLMDAAFDSSPRDLRANWLPVSSLALVAVAVTVAGGGRRRAAAGAGHAVGGRDRAWRHRCPARRLRRDRRAPAIGAAVPGDGDPGGREHAERCERPAHLPGGDGGGRGRHPLLPGRPAGCWCSRAWVGRSSGSVWPGSTCGWCVRPTTSPSPS